MAKERTSVRMQTQIKTLSEQGHSIRRVPGYLRFRAGPCGSFLGGPS
jgi:hypothetical protein